jgi:ribosomal protein S14
MNYFISIEDFKEDTEAGREYSDFIPKDGTPSRVYFAKQKTGYGYKHYLICTRCGTRHTKLYSYHDLYICRSCFPGNVYRIIQNKITGGNDYIAYRMKRFAEAKGIKLKRFPFNYFEYDGKPKYKHWDTWSGNLEVLQALENMRYQSYAYGKRWSSKTVKSILTRTNSLLYLFDLSEMHEYQIFWDKGIDMNTDL